MPTYMALFFDDIMAYTTFGSMFLYNAGRNGGKAKKC